MPSPFLPKVVTTLTTVDRPARAPQPTRPDPEPERAEARDRPPTLPRVAHKPAAAGR